MEFPNKESTKHPIKPIKNSQGFYMILSMFIFVYTIPNAIQTTDKICLTYIDINIILTKETVILKLTMKFIIFGL